MSKFFLVLLATFNGFLASITEEWVTFVDPDGLFQVEMPDSVWSNRTHVETAVGVLEYVTHTSEEEVGSTSVLYSVSYCDYPAGIFHPDSTELLGLFFDATVGSAVESVGGELIYSSDLAQEEYPTRVWKIDATNGVHIKSKASMVNDRYYCLQITTPKSLSVENNGDRFLSSFKPLIE